MGGDNMEEVKFFESWGSIRSLYKHMYTSPAVHSVFQSEAFAAALQDTKIEGPFKVRCLDSAHFFVHCQFCRPELAKIT